MDNGGYKSGSFSWYIRPKPLPEISGCKAEPSTSSDHCMSSRKKGFPLTTAFASTLMASSASRSLQNLLKTMTHPSIEDDLSEYRLCGGGVSAKYLSNIIVIAAIQEITCGLIFVTRDQHFYRQAQLVTLAACRILQFAPCFMALLGNYRNNAYLSIPFMISQAFIGSYADIHTWILLCAEWRQNYPDFFLFSTPLLFLVLPLLAYSALICLILYVQYKAVQFVSVKKMSRSRGGVADETLVESLM